MHSSFSDATLAIPFSNAVDPSRNREEEASATPDQSWLLGSV